MAAPEAGATPDASAPAAAEPPDVAPATEVAQAAVTGEPRSRLRSVLLGVGIGTGVGVAAIAIAFSIIAIPLYIVASTEPGSGLDRTLVRRGLFQVALPFGLVAGIAAGVAIGIWYGRGGRLPDDRTPIHD